MLSERDLDVIDRVRSGDTYEKVGADYGLTRQGIGVIVKKARQHIDQLEIDMLRAVKTGEHPTLLLPYGPDYALAMAYLTWVQRELDRRDVPIEVTTKQTKAGTAFQFRLVIGTTQEQS